MVWRWLIGWVGATAWTAGAFASVPLPRIEPPEDLRVGLLQLVDDDGPDDDGGDDDDDAPVPAAPPPPVPQPVPPPRRPPPPPQPRPAADDEDEVDDDDGPAAAEVDEDDDGPDDGPDGPDDDGPAVADGSGRDDDDDDDGPDLDDPEYAPYEDDDGGTRPLAEDEIVDANGDLARRAQIMAFDPRRAGFREARRLGLRVVSRERLDGVGGEIVIFDVPARLTVREALRRLRSRDRRGTYDYNHLYGFKPTAEGLADRDPSLGPPERDPLTLSGDIVIGMIDAPLDLDHPELQDARIETQDFVEAKAARADHGTAVASLVIGRAGGLAPNARLYSASVFAESERGESIGAALQLVKAIDWMVEEKVPVVNLSLAGPDNAILKAAVARAVRRGHILVAAVGNEGPGADPLYPAAYDGVVGVTAIDGQDKVYRRAGRGPHVDLAARGVDVHSAAGEGYGLHSGTSFAAPLAAVILAERHPAPNRRKAAAAIEAALAATRDLGAPGRDDVYGHGSIDP